LYSSVGSPKASGKVRSAANKIVAIASAATVVLVVACGGPGDVSTGQPGAGTATEATGGVVPISVNRIAYVNLEGELFTTNPDGTDPVQLTGALQASNGSPSVGSQGGLLAQPLNLNDVYAWPTWAPDGTKLAASRIIVRGGNVEMTVQVIDIPSFTFTTVYRNETPGLVAEGAPHYLYWAPDSRTLAFLAAGNQGITLHLWDSQTGGEPVPVETNAPLYFHWAADSGSMVLHSGPEVELRDSLPGGAQQRILADARRFRVPAFSPDGSQVAYVEDTADGGALFVAPIDDLASARRIMEVGSMSAFLWSPDGSTLAVADQGALGSPLFDRLVLVPAGGGEPTEMASESMLAFFWAPTGDKIAWVAMDAQQRRVEWVVGPVSGGEARRLFRFSPSAEAFSMLSFFDQYAYSNSPWSPDGASLVVAGTQQESVGRRNGNSPTGARIYVLDAVGGGPPRDIAAGNVASWSWN
jgi:Tol biopolymer transport system component